MPKLGASFSIKYCQQLGLDWRKVLGKSLEELDLSHYRIMSYWDLIEPEKGEFDFANLDEQISMIEKAGKSISLSIGLRQPRWPESHLPAWALIRKDEGDDQEFAEMVTYFIERVIRRYKDRTVIVSYQLENEALNKGIGINPDYSRARLRHEYRRVKALDSSRPIIMSTSNNIGIPIRAPRPDIVAFSYYMNQHNGKISKSKLIPDFWFALRKKLIEVGLRKKVIIHEMQAEPWGPKSTELMTLGEQDAVMTLETVNDGIKRLQKCGFSHIDLWGLEWWYWRAENGDASYWDRFSKKN